MLYKSSYADFQVLIRPPVVHYHPITGVELSRTKPLRANFGSHGGEFTSPNPMTGELERHAIIHGHFFDSEAAQERLDWTDEERESVEAALAKLAREQPYLLVKVDLTRPKREAPWPTYDETAEKDVVQFAKTLGLDHEALAYELENKARPKIISGLEDGLVEREPEPTPEPKPEEALTGFISL